MGGIFTLAFAGAAIGAFSMTIGFLLNKNYVQQTIDSTLVTISKNVASFFSGKKAQQQNELTEQLLGEEHGSLNQSLDERLQSLMPIQLN